jgi:aminoglycoside phosphotransferase (APT) family kinase protein
MEGFGRSSGFYERQTAIFKTISKTQAQAIDADTKIPVGELPGFDEMVEFFGNKATQPEDRSTLVHGDYKIDNVVFHKSEPRVIGVLDWEMATIGHPLSDLCNLTAPFINAAASPEASKLLPGAIKGLPSREDCIRWYSEVAGWDPKPDLTWGDTFCMFRTSIVLQGIAARYALRQASSERASDYGKMMRPFAMSTWERVKKMKEESQRSAKL